MKRYELIAVKCAVKRALRVGLECAEKYLELYFNRNTNCNKDGIRKMFYSSLRKLGVTI